MAWFGVTHDCTPSLASFGESLDVDTTAPARAPMVSWEMETLPKRGRLGRISRFVQKGDQLFHEDPAIEEDRGVVDEDGAPELGGRCGADAPEGVPLCDGEDGALHEDGPVHAKFLPEDGRFGF